MMQPTNPTTASDAWRVGEQVVIKGQTNLWTIEEVFPSGEVSIRSAGTGFIMSVDPTVSLESPRPDAEEAAR